MDRIRGEGEINRSKPVIGREVRYLRSIGKYPKKFQGRVKALIVGPNMEEKPSTFRLKISLTLKVQIASQRIRRT
ncbi:hypothetical protein VN97_g5615 [Penicillium thymicola]|uniref:Uncharacterized protein n=1 Tax=Penicillium thymicola TaxID=293382 RepID=A0AAI9TIA2_PENTH|nr:hypothetical protein VN97_g5615 [Penicillium thymicola]